MGKPTEPCWRWYEDKIVKVDYQTHVSYPGGDKTKHLVAWFTGWIDATKVEDLDDDKWGERVPSSEELKRLKEIDRMHAVRTQGWQPRTVDEARHDAADTERRAIPDKQ